MQLYSLILQVNLLHLQKNPVDQYTDINVNMNFSVPSTAKTGGQAIISLPKNLRFVSIQTLM